MSSAGNDAIRKENASTGQSVWVHRGDGKYISWAEWNAPGHVLETIILGQWNTDMDCYLAEQAGVQAVRLLAAQGLCKIVNQKNGGAGRKGKHKPTAAAAIEVLSSAWGTKFMRKSEYKKSLC